MSPRWFLRFIFCGMVLLPQPASGGERPPRDYKPIPFDGNLEQMLRAHLNKARGLDDLLKQLQALQGLKIDPGTLDKLKEDPAAIQKLLKKHGAGKDLSDKILKKARDLAAGKASVEVPLAKDRPAASPAGAPAEGLEERFNRWARDLIKDAEGSPVGDLIQQSPAVRRGLMDFEKLIQNGAGRPPLWGLDRLDKLPLPRDLDLSALGKGWDNIRNLSLPTPPSIRIPWPNASMPSIPMPNLPGSGSLAIGSGILWGLVAVGIFLALIPIMRRVEAPLGSAATWRLGPWPVDPAKVATAAELIAAFEYISLLRLGQQARSWHHVLIATRLGERDTAQRQAADELACLYERARYAPECPPLTAELLTLVRHNLCLLAGLAAR